MLASEKETLTYSVVFTCPKLTQLSSPVALSPKLVTFSLKNNFLVRLRPPAMIPVFKYMFLYHAIIKEVQT